MHIPKLLTVFCLSALGTVSIQAQRTDELSPPGSQAGTMMVAMAPLPQTMPTPDVGKSLTPEQAAKARAELRKAIEESKAPAKAEAAAPTPKAAPAPAKAPTAPTTPAPTPTPAAVPTPKPAVAPAAVPATAPPAAEVAPAAVVTPAPAAGSKEARMMELDALYKAGQISASDYQTRRALLRAEK